MEILGVLKNVAPRQNMILARLSGGPLERTGVMAGMSGSPVYIDGKLVGAVASGFQFSKEPIAGITPMEQMLNAFEDGSEAPQQETTQVAWTFEPGVERGDDLRLVPSGEPDWMPPFRSEASRVFWGGAETSMVRIATPLMLSGFTAEAIEHFQPQFRALGLIPTQGGGGSAQSDSAMGDPSGLQPGSMISVQLVRGDMGVNADGTVTLVDQGRVYAFGHRLLSAGPIEIPFSESRVITPLAGYAISMKLSTPGRLLGAIRQDRSSGIFGILGERASMVPIEFEMVSNNRTTRSYQFEVVNDRFLLPLLMNMTVLSAIGSTERMVGESTLQMEQTISAQRTSRGEARKLFQRHCQRRHPGRPVCHRSAGLSDAERIGESGYPEGPPPGYFHGPPDDSDAGSDLGGPERGQGRRGDGSDRPAPLPEWGGDGAKGVGGCPGQPDARPAHRYRGRWKLSGPARGLARWQEGSAQKSGTTGPSHK